VLERAVLTAIADPRRRAILRLVRDVERPSGEIAAHFPDVTGPAVSQHLRVLREAGLLAERRSGTRRLYRARPEGLHGLRIWLRDFWDDALGDLKAAAEYDTQHPEGAAGDSQ
jgi:DNA-binding transcriptional ArsR family regulator